MSFEGKLFKGEKIVLHEKKTNTILQGYVKEDREMNWGGSAIIDVGVTKGLPWVSGITINVNGWDIYREGDPKAFSIIADAYFREV